MAITTAACAVFAETVVSRLIRSRFAPQCRTALSVSRRVHPLGRSGLVGSKISLRRRAFSLSAAAFARLVALRPSRCCSVSRHRCCLARAATCLAATAVASSSPALRRQKTFHTTLHCARAAHPSCCSTRRRVLHARSLTGTLYSSKCASAHSSIRLGPHRPHQCDSCHPALAFTPCSVTGQIHLSSDVMA